MDDIQKTLAAIEKGHAWPTLEAFADPQIRTAFITYLRNCPLEELEQIDRDLSQSRLNTQDAFNAVPSSQQEMRDMVQMLIGAGFASSASGTLLVEWLTKADLGSMTRQGLYVALIAGIGLMLQRAIEESLGINTPTNEDLRRRFVLAHALSGIETVQGHVVTEWHRRIGATRSDTE